MEHASITESATIIELASISERASIIHRAIDYAKRPLYNVDAVDVDGQPWSLTADLLRSLVSDHDFIATVHPLLNGVKAGTTATPVNNYLVDYTIYTFLAQPDHYPPQCMSMTLLELVDLLPPLQFQSLGKSDTLDAYNAQLDF